MGPPTSGVAARAGSATVTQATSVRILFIRSPPFAGYANETTRGWLAPQPLHVLQRHVSQQTSQGPSVRDLHQPLELHRCE
jgi:hypothetical protein